MRRILQDAEGRAAALLSEHRRELDLLTEALLERETLDNAEIRSLLNLPAAEPRTEEESGDAGGTMEADADAGKER